MAAHTPDETIEMTFAKDNAAEDGFNRWTINGVPFSMDKMEPMFRLHQGKRYRLLMRNASDDIHPMHLHRHSFELTRVGGKATAGVIKDVAMLGGYQEMEVDFTADNPGRTLFHCHMQLHMDFGFMALFDYESNRSLFRQVTRLRYTTESRCVQKLKIWDARKVARDWMQLTLAYSASA